MNIIPSKYTLNPREQEAIARGWRPTHVVLVSRPGNEFSRTLVRVLRGAEGQAQCAEDFLADKDGTWDLQRGVWYANGSAVRPPNCGLSVSVLPAWEEQEAPRAAAPLPQDLRRPNMTELASMLSPAERAELLAQLAPSSPAAPAAPSSPAAAPPS